MNLERYRPSGLRWYVYYRLGLKPAHTQTSAAEQACLQRHAQGKRRLAEIGVYHGANTLRFRQVMAPDGVLLAIDPYDRRLGGLLGGGWIRRIAHAEVARSTNGKVIWIETLGCHAPAQPMAAPYLPVDFLFIDGDHSWDGIAGDWYAWREQIAPNGIVALHDSRNSGGCGSERFTQEVVKTDPKFLMLEEVETLTIVQKRFP
jgi:hypothetical protein